MTKKQEAFIEAYLANGFNATQAALTAGYSPKTAYSSGSRLLKDVEVSKAIEDRFAEMAMSANEVLARLSDMARGNMADFIDVERDTINLAKAEIAGKLHLVKKFTHTVSDSRESITVELYDAQAALVHLWKHHQLVNGNPTERHEIDISDAKQRLAHLLTRQSAEGGSGDVPGESE